MGTATRSQVAAILDRFLTGTSTKYNETVVTVTSADGTAVPATLCVPVKVAEGGCPGVVMLIPHISAGERSISSRGRAK